MGFGPLRKADDRRVSPLGYTLTEMLVVLVIIGLISAIVVPQTLGQMDRAKARSARLKLESVAAALEMFSADLARYPTDTEGLAILLDAPSEPADWMGPYLSDPTLLTDPWGSPIRYVPPPQIGEPYTLVSHGADGRPGGNNFNRDIELRPGQ